MLLKTKLYRPKPPPNTLTRTRLNALLDDGQHCPLTICAAPAGYGKTTIISQWLEDKPHGWFSLDERDNDVVQFWRYAIAALQTMGGGVGDLAEQALSMGGDQIVAQIVPSLVNDIWEAFETDGQQRLLVLDDYHLIHTPAIHDSLDLLLDQVPADALRVVLTTRADPPLSLARRRARRQLCELRSADLRFTHDELAELLNKHLGLALSDEAIGMVMTQTEGWVAAIQLTALSLQRQSDAQGFIEAVANNNQFVADYLVAEVIEYQPPHMRQFLTESADLEQLSIPLLDAVFPDRDNAAILHALIQQNIFLIPLDAAQTRFRYHHLFGDLLRQHDKRDAAIRRAILEKASVWHAQQGEWPLAVDYAFSADNEALVASHILTNVRHHPSHTAIDPAWLARLSDAQFEATPLLHVVQVLMLNFAPRPDLIDALQREVERANQRLTASYGAVQSVEPFWQAILCFGRVMLKFADPTFDFAGSKRLVNDVLAILPEAELLLKGRLLYILGFVHHYQHDCEMADKFFQEAAGLAKATHDDLYYMEARSASWSVQLATGVPAPVIVEQLEQFFATSELAKRQHPMVGVAHRILGTAQLELGQFDEAIASFERGLALLMLTSEFGQEFMLRRWFARALQLDGRPDEAVQMAQAIKIRAPYFAPSAQSLLRWLKHLAYDRFSTELTHWASTVNADNLSALRSYDAVLDLVVLGKVFLWQDELDALPSIVSQLDAYTTSKESERNGMAHVYVALFEAALGREDVAVERIARLKACHLGEVRFALIESADLFTPLLKKAVAHPQANPDLLACLPQTTSPKSVTKTAPTLDALTEREREILQLMADGLTNKEIASQLYLSPNTVRVHSSSIYSKLAVGNRTQAAQKGRELGLIV